MGNVGSCKDVCQWTHLQKRNRGKTMMLLPESERKIRVHWRHSKEWNKQTCHRTTLSAVLRSPFAAERSTEGCCENERSLWNKRRTWRSDGSQRKDNCVYSYLKKAVAKIKEFDQLFLFIGKGFSKIMNFEDQQGESLKHTLVACQVLVPLKQKERLSGGIRYMKSATSPKI